jgi:hypothetical protein
VGRRERSGLVVSSFGEPFSGELANRFEQPVAEGSVGGLRHDKALVDQRTEKVGDFKHAQVAEARRCGSC